MTALRRILLAFAALFLLVGTAACGGDDDSGDDDVASLDEDAAEDSEESDDSDGGGNDPASEQEMQDAALEYAQCMRDNGVDMPDPEFDGEGGVMIGGGGPAEEGGPSQEEFEAADEECSPIMEEVAPQQDLSPEEVAELQDQMLQVAQCMRDKGYDMPDPEVGEDGSISVRSEAAPGGGADGPPPQDDDEFMTEMRACEEEVGVDPGGPSGADVEEEDS